MEVPFNPDPCFPATIGGRSQPYVPKSKAEAATMEHAARDYLKAYETFSPFDYLYSLPDADMLLRAKHGLVSEMARPEFINFCKKNMLVSSEYPSTDREQLPKVIRKHRVCILRRILTKHSP